MKTLVPLRMALSVTNNTGAATATVAAAALVNATTCAYTLF